MTRGLGLLTALLWLAACGVEGNPIPPGDAKPGVAQTGSDLMSDGA